MRITKNPSLSYAKNSDECFLFFTNNERFIFRHPHADKFIPNLFLALEVTVELEDVYKNLDFFTDEKEFKNLIHSFIKLKLILKKEENHASEDFFQMYRDVDRGSENSFKNAFVISPYFSTVDLLGKMSNYFNSANAIKNVHDIADKTSLAIVITNKANFSNLFEINKNLKQRGIPWLWFEVEDTSLQIGPIFNWHNEFCFNCCYLRRIGRARSLEAELIFLGKNNKTPNVNPKELSPLWTEIINLEIKKFCLSMKSSNLKNGFYLSNFFTNETSFHPLLIAPTCEVCFQIEKFGSEI